MDASRRLASRLPARRSSVARTPPGDPGSRALSSAPSCGLTRPGCGPANRLREIGLQIPYGETFHYIGELVAERPEIVRSRDLEIEVAAQSPVADEDLDAVQRHVPEDRDFDAVPRPPGQFSPHSTRGCHGVSFESFRCRFPGSQRQ